MSSISPQTNPWWSSGIPCTQSLADACLVAETWGFDDALNDIRPRAAAYFACDSPQWDAYDTGYQAGIELLVRLTGKRSPRQLGIVTAPKGAPTETWEEIHERYGHLFYLTISLSYFR
ncbi:MAG: hypothetical protein R3E79_23930 [Caldilineaceae bacterium]